jgi:hypothetical protein
MGLRAAIFLFFFRFWLDSVLCSLFCSLLDRHLMVLNNILFLFKRLLIALQLFFVFSLVNSSSLLAIN